MPVIVTVGFLAVVGEAEAEPLEQFLRAWLEQDFVAVSAGDDAVVGVFDEHGAGDGAELLVKLLGVVGCHDHPGAVFLDLPARVMRQLGSGCVHGGHRRLCSAPSRSRAR